MISHTPPPSPLIFCAIDTNDLDQALHWAGTIGPITKGLKLGLEFVNSFGPHGIEAVRKACPESALFIDLKFHDIPHTVAQAVKTLCTHFAPAYLNVHAAGGLKMLEAAKAACQTPTKLLAVTVLTSLDQTDIAAIGYRDSLAHQVVRMGKLAKQAHLDGVVCSAHEIAPLREACGEDFILMVPGIRPDGTASHDQNRIMTPVQALETGATHLVIGRPITQSPDPADTALQILKTIHRKGDTRS